METKRVTVCQYGGTIAEKVVVQDLGDVLILTTEEEWEASQRENRDPVTVGFKRQYAIQDAQ